MSAVSAISNTGNADNAASAQTTVKKSTVDYDSFLQLLVEQMKNQDPTKPMDSTEYVAQLANFSNVEQSIQTNEKLDRLLSATTAANAGSMIGRVMFDADGAELGTVSRVTISNGSLAITTVSGQQFELPEGYSLGA